ncbi:MAG: tetratricopeptide repeat protein [Brevinema sp.]
MDYLTMLLLLLSILIAGITGFYFVHRFIPYRSIDLLIKTHARQKNDTEIIRLFEESSKRISLSAMHAVARSYVRISKLKEATTLYERLLALSPQKTPNRDIVLKEYGDVLTQLGNYQDAAVVYQQGIQSAEDSAVLELCYAQNIFDTGNKVQARTLLQDILKKNPSFHEARLLYGEVLSSLGLYAQAIREFGMLERAGRLSPSYGHAKTLSELKMPHRAVSVYHALMQDKKSIEINPMIPAEYARVYIDLSNFEQAKAVIEQNLPKAKGKIRHELLYLDGLMHMRMGEEYKGLERFETLYKEAPNYKDTATIIQKNKDLLEIPNLQRYFTSDEHQFEQLLTRFLPAGARIVFRSLDYYVFTVDDKGYLFYRKTNPLPTNIINDTENLLLLFLPNINLEIWAVGGLVRSKGLNPRSHIDVKDRSEFAKLVGFIPEVK